MPTGNNVLCRLCCDVDDVLFNGHCNLANVLITAEILGYERNFKIDLYDEGCLNVCLKAHGKRNLYVLAYVHIKVKKGNTIQ